jgi:hypothetical protein
MAYLTLCSRCRLESLRKRAKREKKHLTTAPAEEGGINVYINAECVGWFMFIGEFCEC